MSRDNSLSNPNVIAGAIRGNGEEAARARKRGDSRRLYTIRAGLGMRAAERTEVTDNSQS